MKKILLSLIVAAGFASSASAQLADGTVFPDFTVTDINGMSHNLYSDLDAGKTVFIDISATWCGPCWSYHLTGALDSIWAKHGPAGQPGVDATTTNDAVVYFFQGEPTSGMAELTNNTIGSGAVTTGGTYATFTQGNWVAGTHYYIVDDSTAQGPRNTLWNINYFPTVYMICRDHLVKELTQPTEAQAMAAIAATCPSTPPASGSSVDAKSSAYGGSGYFVCNAVPSVTFQNYSTTASITSATVTVTDATGTTVATVPWSGSLAPYAVQNVSIPSFAGTSFGGYKYNVTVTGDINTANNISVDSVFKVYGDVNAAALPFSDDLMSTLSYKYTLPSDYSIGLPNPAWAGCPNPAGVTTNRYLLFDYFDFNVGTGIFDAVVGNFNTTGVSNLKFQFDQAYKQYPSTSDAMAVKVSNDCGATWHTVWSASGATLATVTGTTTSAWNPTAAGDWAHRVVDIPVADEGTNMMLKFTGTSDYGNFGWVTNLNLSSIPTSVPQVLKGGFISVTPNPAKDVAFVNITMNEAATVTVELYDAVGRVVNTVSSDLTAGDQKIQLSTSDLAGGVYYVKISAGADVTTKTLSVIK